MFAAPLLIFQLAIFTPLGFVMMILRNPTIVGFRGWACWWQLTTVVAMPAMIGVALLA